MGARAALGIANHLHDAREQGFAAHPFGAHDEATGAVERAASDAIAGIFFNRERLAGQKGLVDRTFAFEDYAIDGDTLAGTHAQAIATGHAFEGRVAI